MRRSIVLISLLAAAALSMLAPATPANAIICPQAIPSCCPVPVQTARGGPHLQPICCRPTTCCATGTTTSQACCPSACCTPSPCTPGSLTIAASPSPSKAGQTVVISGAFVGTAVSGAQVVLWRERAGQSSFQQVGQTATDSAGRYTFTLKRGTVMADQKWYVTSNGVQSTTVQQPVDALVGMTASAGSATVGQSIVLRGRVTPSHAGQVVLVEASRGSIWRVIARPRLGHGSSYAVSHRFAQSGAVELRVVLNGDRRNERSISRTVTVRVKP